MGEYYFDVALYLVETTRVADHTFQVTCVLIGNAPFEGDARINLI